MFASPRSLIERLRSRRRLRRSSETEFDALLDSIKSESTFHCVVCDSPMMLAEDLDVGIGVDGARLHQLHCAACGMRVERLYHPNIGYPTLPTAIVRSLAERRTAPEAAS